MTSIQGGLQVVRWLNNNLLTLNTTKTKLVNSAPLPVITITLTDEEYAKLSK